MSDVSIIETTRDPRKYLSTPKRMELVQKSLVPGTNTAVVARKHNVGVSSLIRWRRNALEGSFMGVKADDSVVPASEVKRLKEKVRELERMLCKKTLKMKISGKQWHLFANKN